MAAHASILVGESQGQRSLASYRPRDHKESGTAEVTEHTRLAYEEELTWFIFAFITFTLGVHPKKKKKIAAIYVKEHSA